MSDLSALDHSLIYQARKLITGANVHTVLTWIFCYEGSEPDSERRVHYQELLQDFVASQNRIRVAQLRAELVRETSMILCAASDDLNRQIDKVFR
jgi:hypothetical protein